MTQIAFKNAPAFVETYLDFEPHNSEQLKDYMARWEHVREQSLREWGATFVGSGLDRWYLEFEDEQRATLFLLRWE